jgi:hypothetical protein
VRVISRCCIIAGAQPAAPIRGQWEEAAGARAHVVHLHLHLQLLPEHFRRVKTVKSGERGVRTERVGRLGELIFSAHLNFLRGSPSVYT